LVSSKINQWTLLIAMLPLVFSVARGEPSALALDPRQQEEVLLTAAQSLFALVLLLDLRLGLVGAGTLFGLFAVQMLFPETRGAAIGAYAVLTGLAVAISGRELGRAFEWIRRKEVSR
jgi:cation:H+ antiporter